MKVVLLDEVMLSQRLDVDLLLEQRVHRDGRRAGIFHLALMPSRRFDSGDADGTMGFFRVRPM